MKDMQWLFKAKTLQNYSILLIESLYREKSTSLFDAIIKEGYLHSFVINPDPINFDDQFFLNNEEFELKIEYKKVFFSVYLKMFQI